MVKATLVSPHTIVDSPGNHGSLATPLIISFGEDRCSYSQLLQNVVTLAWAGPFLTNTIGRRPYTTEHKDYIATPV